MFCQQLYTSRKRGGVGLVADNTVGDEGAAEGLEDELLIGGVRRKGLGKQEPVFECGEGSGGYSIGRKRAAWQGVGVDWRI